MCGRKPSFRPASFTSSATPFAWPPDRTGTRDIKPIYTAPNPGAEFVVLDELDANWGKKYGAMIRLWRNAWDEFIPFLDYDIEIRRMICSRTRSNH
jgi:transposase-like protein